MIDSRQARRAKRAAPIASDESLDIAIPSPLVGRRVARMNGAGNKILVLDLRGAAIPPTPEEARAIHRAPGLDYDQMMVLSDPREPERSPTS